MVYKNTLDAILENVKEISSMVAGFTNFDKIPDIDMDLALEKVRNLYDILLMLKQSHLKEDNRTTDKIPGSEATPDSTSEKADKTDNKGKIISDRFKSQSTSLHDSFLKSEKYDDLSTKLKSKPITNIADAIGINDKFIFIKELFGGNENKYYKTIEVLNDATNFNDAYNYLIGNFNWDMDSSLVQILLDLIRRKLITKKDE
jgi:hypothetical protein